MPASSIDEVLSQLELIIAESRKTSDRTGFFASMYYKVTAGVRQGITKGEFEDGLRMEKFDVIFANRYLDALNSWKNKSSLTGSWKIALDSTKKSSLLLIQHLLLGINAHINPDLGIAAVETMQGFPIESIRKDFDAINGIMANTRGFMRFTVWFIHLFEWKRPCKIIGVMNSFSRLLLKLRP